jgi:hypothetical protein
VNDYQLIDNHYDRLLTTWEDLTDDDTNTSTDDWSDWSWEPDDD